MLAGDKIFRPVNAASQDVANAQGDVGQVRAFFEQAQLQAEGAVVVAVVIVVGEVAVAERARKPWQHLKTEVDTLGVLQRADRGRDLAILGHMRRGHVDEADLAEHVVDLPGRPVEDGGGLGRPRAQRECHAGRRQKARKGFAAILPGHQSGALLLGGFLSQAGLAMARWRSVRQA